MIEYGVGCSFITNGLMDVQLWVPYDDLTTLFYDVGEGPWTRVERALCACLMSFRTPLRDQAWRNAAQSKLPKWHSVLDSDRSQLLMVDLTQNTGVDDTSSEFASPEQTTSDYLPSSSPITSGARVTTRAAASCAPPSDPSHQESSSDSEADPTASAGRKRGFSQVTSSPPT
jgi:hypothetical protein